MSYDDYDYQDAGYDKLLQELSEEAAKYSLGVTGDAIEARVESCLREADELLALNYAGPVLALAATAGELIIRFLLVRPLVQSAFFNEEMASIIADRIGKGRSSADRALLPKMLRHWNIKIDDVKTASGIAVWEFMLNRLWPERDNFIHKGDRPTIDTAKEAVECVRCFRETVVGKLASKLGFTLKETGKWSEIKGQNVFGVITASMRYDPCDPISGIESTPTIPTPRFLKDK